MSDYEFVVRGSIHIKSGQGIKKKKRKKVHKKLDPNLEARADEKLESNEVEDVIPSTEDNKTDLVCLTKSQIEWEKRRDKRILESVLNKAHKSHKQRIIEFNNYLGTLTEHFDIQKVSWTK